MPRDEGDPRHKNPNSEEERERRVPFEAVLIEYPYLKEYLEQHRRAQIQGDKRLMSPEEKIKRFGGIDQVKRNLQGANTERVVLQACRDGIMVGIEVIHFAETIGVDIDPAALHSALYRLQDSDEPELGKIKEVPDITLIYEVPLFSPGRRWVIAQRMGFLTTDEGVRHLARDPRRESTQGWLGRDLRPREN